MKSETKLNMGWFLTLHIDVMYSTDPHQRQKSIIFTPLGRSISSIDKVARYMTTWRITVLEYICTVRVHLVFSNASTWMKIKEEHYYFFFIIGCTVPLGAMMCVLINALKTE